MTSVLVVAAGVREGSDVMFHQYIDIFIAKQLIKCEARSLMQLLDIVAT